MADFVSRVMGFPLILDEFWPYLPVHQQFYSLASDFHGGWAWYLTILSLETLACNILFILFSQTEFLKNWAKFEKYWEKYVAKSSWEIEYFGSFWGSVATKWKLSWPIEGAKGQNFPEMSVFERECSVFTFINKTLTKIFGKLQIKLFAQFCLKTKVGSSSLPEFAARN